MEFQASDWGLSVVDKDGEEVAFLSWEEVLKDYAQILYVREATSLGVKLPKALKVLWDRVDDEPFFVIRAKDDLARKAVASYKHLAVLDGGIPSKSDFCRSIEEWLDRAYRWRAEHRELCKLPDL